MPLSIDAFNKLVLVTSPTTEVDAQTLHDFVEDYMASPVGMINDGTWARKGDILLPEGKIEDPSQPGVFSQIILIWNPEWQVQFWGGSGYTRIFGGKMVGGVGDQPMKATGTAGDITVMESPVDGVTVATGSGLSAAQSTQLAEVHGQIQRSVFINTEAITNGNGYQQTPYNNFTDAVDFAEANVLLTLALEADADLDRDLANFTIDGINLPTVDLGGFDVNNLIITECTVTGAQGPTSAGPLLCLTCNVLSLTDFNGSMLTVSVTTKIGIADGAFCLLNEVVPAVGGVPWELDMGAGGAASTVQARNLSGAVEVSNMDNNADALHLGFIEGTVTIKSTCTGTGTISLAGDVVPTIEAGANVTVLYNGLALESWQDRGLDPANPKVITENTAGTSYDEDIGLIQKLVRKIGAITTITRQ
jgi:hypothetical protein